MCLQPNLGRCEMRALTQTCECWREDLVTSRPQVCCDRAPLPSTGPTSVEQNIRGHERTSCWASSMPSCRGFRANRLRHACPCADEGWQHHDALLADYLITETCREAVNIDLICRRNAELQHQRQDAANRLGNIAISCPV